MFENNAMISYATDIVLVRVSDSGSEVLLIQRGWEPFAGSWALPGGLVDEGETSLMAAYRELAEETSLHATGLQFVGVYDNPARDPRGRVVSVAYAAIIRDRVTAIAGDDAVATQWMPLSEVLHNPTNLLAFDHNRIIRDAVDRLFPDLAIICPRCNNVGEYPEWVQTDAGDWVLVEVTCGCGN